MATTEKVIYVCDSCGYEADQDDVDGAETWIVVGHQHYCKDCWDII